MSQTTLVASALYSVAAALIYGLVARHFIHRRVSEEARGASLAFAVWWGALATTSAIGSLLTAMAAAGSTSLVVFFTATYLLLWLICLALAGLLYYLLYVFTGWRRALLPIALAYLGLFLVFVWLINALEPVGVVVNDWGAQIEYRQEASPVVGYILLLALVAPAFVMSLAYFSLAFRLKAREHRFRVVVVSLSIALWFGSSLLASALRLTDFNWWPIVSRLIGLLAALAILLAYEMPGWLKRRIGEPPASEAMAEPAPQP